MPLDRAVRMKSARPTSSMVVRVSLVTTTVDTDASTIAGRTRYWNCDGAGKIPRYHLFGPKPCTGRRAHAGQWCCNAYTPVTGVMRYASTKTGVALTMAVARVVRVSANEYLRTAARTPTPIPIVASIIIAQKARRKLVGAFSFITEVTLLPSRYDVPKSNVATPLRYLAYCTITGLSRPYFSRTFCRTCSSTVLLPPPAIRFA